MSPTDRMAASAAFQAVDPNALVVTPVDLRGKIAIVTGANSGLGYAIARDLAKLGCKVVLACRNLDSAAAARSSIREQIPGADVSLAQLDVSSLASVRAFVKSWSGRPFDYLVNNAGTAATRHVRTIEGHEGVYATNALGPYLLTLELLPFMRAHARIIFNSSIAIYDIKALDAHLLESEDVLGDVEVGDVLELRIMLLLYARSKAVQGLIVQELARHLQSVGTSISIHAVHPGIVSTAMWTGKPHYYKTPEWEKRMQMVAKIALPVDAGANAIVHAVIGPDAGAKSVNGSFWDRQHRKEAPAWFADRHNTERIIARLERDASLRIRDVLPAAAKL